MTERDLNRWMNRLEKSIKTKPRSKKKGEREGEGSDPVIDSSSSQSSLGSSNEKFDDDDDDDEEEEEEEEKYQLEVTSSEEAASAPLSERTPLRATTGNPTYVQGRESSPHLFSSREEFLKRLPYYIPILAWLPQYSWRQSLLGDVISGLSVGLMLIPQCLAFASIVGVSPIGLEGSSFSMKHSSHVVDAYENTNLCFI